VINILGGVTLACYGKVDCLGMRVAARRPVRLLVVVQVGDSSDLMRAVAVKEESS
jgi:hypothetical protein